MENVQSTRKEGGTLSCFVFPEKKKTHFRDKRVRSYAAAHRDGLFPILVLHRSGFRFICPFRLFSSSVFFYTFPPLPSVHVNVAFRSVHESYTCVSSCNLSTGSRRKSVCLLPDGESRINCVSTLVCLVDWQRCTQTRYSCMKK